MSRHCEHCGRDISAHHCQARFCGPTCKRERLAIRGGAAAHRAVRDAIARGELPPASTQRCKDCGGAAHDYDHRDYAEPLSVDAVCRSCNCRRGPARSTRSPTSHPNERAGDKTAKAG